jgi:hypothetical protein
MDTAIATDVDGNGIRRLRRTPGITAEGKRIPIDRFQLLMDVGVAAQGQNPMAMMRLSEDGGRTWGNERQASVGRIGNYRQRVYWDQLGAPEDVVIECTWTDAAPTRVLGAWVNNLEQAA